MLVDVNHIRYHAGRLLGDFGLPTRRARAARDALLLACLVELEPERADLQMVLHQAFLAASDCAPRQTPCAACGPILPKYWAALASNPSNAGLHCYAHTDAFHSVCGATYNCICCEPYDPDRDYEWRAPIMPQEW